MIIGWYNRCKIADIPYGAWMNPEGAEIEVPYQSHDEVANEILGKDFWGDQYEAMFQKGYIRVINDPLTFNIRGWVNDYQLSLIIKRSREEISLGKIVYFDITIPGQRGYSTFDCHDALELNKALSVIRNHCVKDS